VSLVEISSAGRIQAELASQRWLDRNAINMMRLTRKGRTDHAPCYAGVPL